MGMDLSLVRHPDIIPPGLPEILRESPGYFRGVPWESLAAAGILDSDTMWPASPAWPPDGMTEDRAEAILRLFEPPCDGDPETSVVQINPTYRELRKVQQYVREHQQNLSQRSRKQGKVPAFKFGSNDGWHVTPEECLIIASRLQALLRTDSHVEEREFVHGFALFNEWAARHGGYEVW